MGASSRRDFRLSCRNRWVSLRAELEPRELDDALDQCEETIGELEDMLDDGSTCDELRALYFAR
jgi:hypothetical protein